MEEPPPPPSPSPLLSAACIVCTIGMFGSGLSDLRQMVATKSVENVQLLPFLTTHVNNLSWLGYGCMKGDRTLMAVNGIGAALQSLYIAVYCYYSPAKPAVLLRVAALLALLAAAVAAFAALGDRRSRTERLGLLSCAFTVGMYGCPLGAMVRAARSRSVRCLSLPLTVGTFMAAGCWTLYGLRLRDPFIAIPNIPGVLTSTVRFWLFWRYAERPQGALHT